MTQSPAKKITKIGIAVTAYKPNPTYFVEQLQSFVNQTHQQWFCVIRSDSDISEFVNVPSIQVLLKDPRFKVIQNKDRLGVTKNFEAALKDVLHEFPDAVAFSDQDDIWYANKLERQIEVLERCPPKSLVHTNMHELKTKNAKDSLSKKTVWDLERRDVNAASFKELLMRNIVNGTTLMMDADLAREYQDIPSTMNIHDHWFALAASLHGGVYPIVEPLMAYRQHGGNLVGVNAPFELNKDMIFNLYNKSRLKYARSIAMLKSFESVNNEDSKLYNAKDKGAGFLSFGLTRLLTDPALAKSAIGLAIGKFLS